MGSFRYFGITSCTGRFVCRLYLHSTAQYTHKTRTNSRAWSGLWSHDLSARAAKTLASDRAVSVIGVGNYVSSFLVTYTPY